MNIRQIILGGLAIVILVSSFFLYGKMSESKEPPNKQVATVPVKTVETLVVKNTEVNSSIAVFGKVTATEKLEIFSEVNGALVSTSKPFKKGTYFEKGDILLIIDNEEQRLSLQAAKSNLMNAITQMMPDLKLDYPESFPQWQKYLNNFSESERIREMPQPVNDREKYFVASRNIYSQYYTIRSQEVRLSKYTIFAPFSGIVTQTSIYPGTVIRAGQKLGELMNTASYELEAPVSLSDLELIRKGDRVSLISEDIGGKWNGYIKRIGESIDPNTQSATLYIGVQGSRIKENMYLKGTIQGGILKEVYELPRSLMLEGGRAYAIRDSILETVNFQVLRLNEESALVRGLKDGTLLISKSFPGIYEGMKVKAAKNDEPS